MCLMCWDVDIVHRPDSELVDANYWLQLGIDIDFDPLFREYLKYTHHLRHSSPVPTDLPMHPKNMPYYRGPCFQRTCLPKVPMPIHCIFRAFWRISQPLGAGAILISRTYLFVLANRGRRCLLPHHLDISSTRSWRCTHDRQRNTTGPCIHFQMDIFCHPLHLTVCHSLFTSHVIHQKPVALCSMSSRQMLSFSVRGMPSSIISNPLGSNQS